LPEPLPAGKLPDNPERFDIVVVGAGGAGFAAAITAAELGRSVGLLERAAEVGGTTARSVGSITASGTRLQAAAGVEDSVEAHFEDMAKFAGPKAARDNLELRRLLVEASAETIAFLERLGVVFFGPMPEPPHRVPRMHNVLPNSRALVRLLAKRARQAGVRLFVDTAATALIHEGGRTVGVEAGSGDRRRRFGARQGVILTTGDFSGSVDLRRQHLAEALWEIDAANPDSTGDGQRLGSEVGASIVNADLIWGPEIRFIAPEGRNLLDRLPPSPAFARLVLWSLKHLPAPILRPFLMMFVTTNLAPNLALLEEGAILVNAEGRRFVEAGEDPAFAMARQPGKVAYFLLDDQVAEKFSAWPHFISTAPGLAYAYFADYRRNRKDITRSAPSIEALAARIGIDGEALAETVRGHNAAGGSKLARPPFHALGPAKPWIMFTEGGLGVDTALRVLDDEDRPIPGLYAAGSAGQGGLILDGHGHHLGWAFASGRLAARSAAGAN
jgi:fumarate reductase flavoprotein subunit